MLATIIFRNVRRDETVFRLALRAADLGERRAMFLTSYHYEMGVGTKKDLGRARHWMERAAVAGHVGAMDEMTKGYLHGAMGFKRDERKAEFWATRARMARNLQ
jgi:TPR repeat protein